MDSECLHDMFNWMPIEDIIEYLNTYEIDFFADENIESIIQAVYHLIDNYETALSFAKAFRLHIPDGLILAKVYSIVHGRTMTLMDALLTDSFLTPNKMNVIEALESTGFKYALDCNPCELHELHRQFLQSDNTLMRYIDDITFHYDYHMLRISKGDLHEELIQHLFHPIKIEKWIRKGRAIEEYLN